MSGAYDASSKTIVVYRDPGDSITVPITSINSAPAYDTEAHGQWLALIINPERFGCTVQLTTREVCPLLVLWLALLLAPLLVLWLALLLLCCLALDMLLAPLLGSVAE